MGRRGPTSPGTSPISRRGAPREASCRRNTTRAPRPAYRFRPITAPSTTYDDPTVGENPQYGASINYYVKAAPSPASPAKLTIVDDKGAVVRTLTSTAGVAGINRAYWDLRFDPS